MQFMRMMSLINGQNLNSSTPSNDTPQSNQIPRTGPEEGNKEVKMYNNAQLILRK